MEKILIAVVGPTAIGKTALSIKLAQHFNTEIISADSRQFFKEMHIGTAVPSKEELETAPHHFIQHISIDEDYSVGQYESEAIDKLEYLYKKHEVVIMVGGSGLYINAVIDGLDSFPAVDKNLRERLRKTFDKEGLKPFQKQLKKLDPAYYNQVDINNVQRVLRAIEVCISSGKPYSSYLNAKKKERLFKTFKIGLKAERPLIYDRINRRVDLMLDQGLEQEALKLLPYKAVNALNTVGYKEFFNYFEGVYDKDFAISEIKKNTRRFAKRQLTWYRKDPEIVWFDIETTFSEVAAQIESIIKPGNNDRMPGL